MLPDQQSEALIKSGALVDLLPGCSTAVKLHWHRWNLNSPLLERFSRSNGMLLSMQFSREPRWRQGAICCPAAEWIKSPWPWLPRTKLHGIDGRLAHEQGVTRLVTYNNFECET
jgi:hypothetical protein